MTEPHPPAEPADEPLTEVEDHVLDVVDAVATAGPADPAAPIAAQHEARAAVSAPVDVPALARERAIKAALAARHRPADDGPARADREPDARGGAGRRGDGDGDPVSLADRRTARGRASRWLLPIAGAAAAFLILAGVVGTLSRGSSDTASTSAASDQASSGAANEVPVGTPAGGSSGPVDFGVANDERELAAAVHRIAGDVATESYTSGAPAAASGSSPPGDPTAAPAPGQTDQSGTGGGNDLNTDSARTNQRQAAKAADCQVSATSTLAAPGAQMLVTTGSVVYQGVPAIVYVFAPAPGTTIGQIVAVSAEDCRVLVSGDL